MKIILDTNFLVSSIKFKIDIFSELKGNELFVLDNVIKELEKICEGKGKDSISAKLALKLLKTKKIEILKDKKKHTDDSLIYYGKKGYIIATQDIKLKKKLKKKRVKFIYLRQKKYVFGG